MTDYTRCECMRNVKNKNLDKHLIKSEFHRRYMKEKPIKDLLNKYLYKDVTDVIFDYLDEKKFTIGDYYLYSDDFNETYGYNYGLYFEHYNKITINKISRKNIMYYSYEDTDGKMINNHSKIYIKDNIEHIDLYDIKNPNIKHMQNIPENFFKLDNMNADCDIDYLDKMKDKFKFNLKTYKTVMSCQDHIKIYRIYSCLLTIKSYENIYKYYIRRCDVRHIPCEKKDYNHKEAFSYRVLNGKPIENPHMNHSTTIELTL